MMQKNDKIRPLAPLFPNVCVRFEALVIRHEEDAAYIDMAAVNNEGTALGSYTVKLPRTVVLPSASSCDLMEGGMGI